MSLEIVLLPYERNTVIILTDVFLLFFKIDMTIHKSIKSVAYSPRLILIV